MCADLILSCKDELVQRVNESRRICKALLSQGLLTEDKYWTIVESSRSQDRMKQLLHALSSKGQQGREALYRLLQEHEPELTLQMGKLHSKLIFLIFFVFVGMAHSILFIPVYSPLYYLTMHTHTHLNNHI